MRYNSTDLLTCKTIATIGAELIQVGLVFHHWIKNETQKQFEKQKNTLSWNKPSQDEYFTLIQLLQMFTFFKAHIITQETY